MHSKNFRFEDGDEGGLLLHYGRSLGTPLWDLPYERLWQLQRAMLGQRFLREWSRYTRTFLSFFNNNNNKFIVKICFSDIDECRTIPDLCKNGLCINTLGSYRCVCNKGYKADKSGTQCVGKYSQVLSIVKISIEWDIYIYLYRILDINECELTPRPCKYNCQNTEGSFICSCPAGFILNPDGVSCRDLDECATGNHLCQQNCINTQGSYTCGCQEGYTQDGDACHGLSRWRDVKILCSFDSFLMLIRNLYRSFPDINECDQSGTCPKPGTCINTLGSFRCICPRGFKLDQSGRFCIDQNECADDSTCEHGCQVSISSSFLKFSFAFSSFKFVDFSELYGKLSLRVSGRIRSTSLL